MRRTLTALATAVVAATVGLVTALPAVAADSPPSHASAHHVTTSPYVALGDSYSSAAGVAPFVPGSPPTCSRSLLNYPHDIAAATEAKRFTDVTCSGARTSDFFTSQAAGVPPQLDAVTEDTRLVTMTIGGNDGGAFTGILSSCVSASTSSGDVAGHPCADAYGSRFTDIVAEQTYPNLVKALTAVHQKAPRATVAILGYPRALPDTGVPTCYPAMPISMGDVPYVNEWALTLNAAVEKAAAETGSRFIDMSISSAGHDACQTPEQRWIEPLNGPVNAAPVHPNAAGEAAMAEETLAQLGRCRTA